MNRLLLGIIAGFVFAVIDVLIMIPLELEDKKAAMAGAFVNRFAIGLVIGAAELPLPGWLSGALFGLLLSLPDAIITKAWGPILGIGAVGGVLIGLAIGQWGI